MVCSSFGCSECYDTFSNPIDSLLKNLHGTAKHIGRGSDSKAEEIKVEITNSNEENAENKNNKKNKLQKELEKAIKEERYEDAAKIRDMLKERGITRCS